MNAKEVIESMWELSGDLLNPHAEVFPNKGGRMGSRTGTILDLTEEQVTKILGFEPYHYEDPDKVTKIWVFRARVEDGPVADCAVWDYKGSASGQRPKLSTGGPSEIFRALFRQNYETLRGEDEPYGWRWR